MDTAERTWETSRESEITYFDHKVVQIDKYVIGLDVSVDHVVLV